MQSPASPESPVSEEPLVPFPRIAAFVRQVTHDVRNDLNSLDLQAAYVTELVTDPEAAEEMKRLRALIQTSAKHLQALSGNFQAVRASNVNYTAGILLEDLRDRLGRIFPTEADRVKWEVALQEEALEVDVELFFGALMELFRNAFQFSEEGQEIGARASVESGHFTLEITEAKPAPATPPEQWGEEPFKSTRRSGYGLGLFRARRALKVGGGDLKIFYDSGRAVLRTRVVLPLASPP